MPSARDLVGAGMPYRWANLIARIPDSPATAANLSDNTNGTADDTVADASTAVTGVDGTGSNAASKSDVDARLTTIDANFADLTAKVNVLLTACRNAGIIS